MKKRLAIMTAVAMMSSSMLVQAATFTSADSTVQVETPGDSWYVDDFEGAILFVTDGNDRVSVKVFEKGEELPSPMKSEDVESYEEIYQTYYTTADCTYIITGLAQTKTDMKTVRQIVQSIQLEDHMDSTSEEATTEETDTTPEGFEDQIDHTDTFYYEDGSSMKVYILKDGSIVDSNGNKVTPYAEGVMKNSDGSEVYEFNPTQSSLDEYLNGPNNEEYNDTDFDYGEEEDVPDTDGDEENEEVETEDSEENIEE